MTIKEKEDVEKLFMMTFNHWSEPYNSDINIQDTPTRMIKFFYEDKTDPSKNNSVCFFCAEHLHINKRTVKLMLGSNDMNLVDYELATQAISLYGKMCK